MFLRSKPHCRSCRHLQVQLDHDVGQLAVIPTQRRCSPAHAVSVCSKRRPHNPDISVACTMLTPRLSRLWPLHRMVAPQSTHFSSLESLAPKMAFLMPQAKPLSDLSCSPASWKSFAMALLIAVSLCASAACCSCCWCSFGCWFAKDESFSSRRACSFTSSG